MTQRQLQCGCGRSRARAVLVPLVKAGVSVALLALLFSKVDVARLWSVGANGVVPWLAGGAGALPGHDSGQRLALGPAARGRRASAHAFRRLTSSFLVATFFNNFLPSNIGGDVVRIADTAPAAGSKTLATTVVLIDRGLGLLGLVLVAALGASAGTGPAGMGPVGPGGVCGPGSASRRRSPRPPC